MSVSMDVRIDIRTRLLQTGKFNVVQIGGSPEEYGVGSSAASLAFMAIPSTKTQPRWDGADQTGYTEDDRLVVTVVARNTDPATRDQQAEDLLDTLRKAVNGKNLAGVTVPDHTYVEASRPLPPKAPERRIEAVVTMQYLFDGWSNEPDGDED